MIVTNLFFQGCKSTDKNIGIVLYRCTRHLRLCNLNMGSLIIFHLRNKLLLQCLYLVIQRFGQSVEFLFLFCLARDKIVDKGCFSCFFGMTGCCICATNLIDTDLFVCEFPKVNDFLF